MISKDAKAISPTITTNEDGILWTVYASKTICIPKDRRARCPTGLRIIIPKGVIGVWQPHEPDDFPSFEVKGSNLNEEDTGSSIHIPGRNKGPCPYVIIEQGKPMAQIQFKKGDYTRTSILYDTGHDLPSVCALTSNAKCPKFMALAKHSDHTTPSMYWQMYTAEDVLIPAWGTVEAPLGVTFDVPSNMYGVWERFPNTYKWTADYKHYDDEGTSQVVTDTSKVELSSYRHYDVLVPKHQLIGVFKFHDRDTDIAPPYEIPMQASICSIEPGAQASRANRLDPWGVHPKETVRIPPRSRQVVETGITFHVPPAYTAQWRTSPVYGGRVVPIIPNYVKDPEVLVENKSTEPILLTPSTPIAMMVLND